MSKPGAFQSLPKGTKIYTPTRRLASVQEIDATGRVHVVYVDSRVGGKPEEGVFPLSFVKQSDIYNGEALSQQSCGKGDKRLEFVYEAPSKRAIITGEDSPVTVWTYDAVGRKRGA